jgi:RHS repeat-associated protein
MIARLRRLLERRGGSRVALETLLILQVLHLSEHAAQMIQLHVLGWPPASARGVISNLDVEKVHFAWNVAVLATLLWLRTRGVRSGWITATLVWAALHTSEHGFLLARALLTGVEGAPGILGAGGWLARHGWSVIGLGTWSRASVHFAWNSVEVALLALAYAAGTVRPALARPFARAWTERGVVLGLLLIVPSTAGGPAANVTALAPVEVWADGLRNVTGLAIDAAGNLYVSDAAAGTVTRVAPDRSRTVVVRGLDQPMGLALDANGRLVICEERGGRVVRVEATGGRTSLATGLRQPRWLAVDARGVVFVTALRGGGEAMAVLALQPNGRLDVFADDFKSLEALAVGEDALFAAAKGRPGGIDGDGAIFEIPIRPDGSAGPVAAHGPADRFKMPVGLALDRRGALYLTTKELGSGAAKVKDAIAKLHEDGSVAPFASDLGDPQALALDADGNLYVSTGAEGRVLRFRAPSAPTLDALPAFTNRSTIAVGGTTDPGARVDLFGAHGPPASATAGAEGRFAISLSLAPDAVNPIAVVATAHGGQGLASPPAEATVIHDGVGPSLVFQAPAATGFVRGAINVQARATDSASGVATLALSSDVRALAATLTPTPPAAAVTATAVWNTAEAADGTHTLAAVSSDRAGNSRPVTRVVIVDNTPPATQVLTGPSGETDATTATFTLAGTDNLTPPENLAFAWRLDGAEFGAFTMATTATVVGLADGPHTFEVKARDLAGNEDPTPATRAFTVTTRPAIATVSPASGVVGTLVTIGGRGFAPGATQVAFAGTAAVVRTVTPSTITVTVPTGARSGPVTATTPRGSAASAQDFTLTATQDFSVRAVPAGAAVPQGSSTTYTVSLLEAEAAAFSGLASLSVAGLPAGVGATFAPSAVLSGRQLRTLTLTAAPSAALGKAAITITATGPVDGASVTRTATVGLEVVGGGRTAALGQVTFVDGTPIAGARLTLAGATATSDAGGNFQFLDVLAGTQMLGVDANAAQAGLPIYGVDVTLTAGQATQLPAFRLTPPPAADRFVPIANATAAQVVSDPRYPDFSITLPAGAAITGWDGTVKTRVAIERLSPDALPVPPPPGPTRSLYQLFFGTPMGGLPSVPLPLTLPNDQDLAPGEKAEIWYYDAAPVPGVPSGWRLAGLGTVSADGRRVVSDPGVGISRFCGVCGTACIVKRAETQPNVNPRGPKAGEPVDLGTGLMVVDKTDLLLSGRLPASLRRSYNPHDPFGRVAGFELVTGPGWTLSVDAVLLEESPSLRRLVLPGNSRFAFALQPDGTFGNSTFPEFAGAVLKAQPDGHTLRFKDGSVWRFGTGYLPRTGLPIPILGLHLLVAQSDRNGNTLTVARDQFGAPVRLTEPGGRSLSLTVDTVAAGVWRLLSTVDPIGRTVGYGYSASAPFRLETVTDALGGITRYIYDAAGRMASITDPRGVTFVTNDHDAQGRVIRQTQADGGVWTFAYTGPPGAHASAAVTDPNGHLTLHRLDGAGFELETVDALGQLTRHERDAAGRITATTDPLGRVTRFAYDVGGNLTTVTDALGQVSRFTYEPTFNRVTSTTDALGQVSRREYDVMGNLTALVDPLGQRTTLTYDLLGQPVAITDPQGAVTRFEYDTVGNLSATVDALGQRTTHEYDAVSRPVRRRDALGQTTTMGYDAHNQVATVLDGLGGTTSFRYDPNGNLVTVTDARGGVTRHAWDAMDRLVSRTDPIGATESFAYDGVGNLTRHVDRKGQVATFVYDARDRRRRAVYADATVDLVFDAAGRLVQAGDSMEGTIVNQYDALDRLLAQTTGLGVVAYQYDAVGRRTTMTPPGQAPVTYAYDLASRLTSIAQAGQLAQFEYDSVGRRTRLTLPNQVSTEYRYDPASRLTALVYRAPTGPLGDLAYEYDATGNRTSIAGSFARTLLPSPVATATYDAANRQRTFGPVTMTYDANGNPQTEGAKSYSWDARNRLVAFSDAGDNATFAYDALGRRSRKVVSGVERRFTYDGFNPVQLMSSTGDVNNILSGLDIDEFLVFQELVDQHMPLTDGVGSTIAELDAAARVGAEYTYEPFGRTSVVGTPRTPFQYTGRENDGTDLYYYRTRYYRPGLARFIAEDSVPPHFRATNELNAYSYGVNNPILFTDPLGLAVTLGRTNYCGPGGGGPVLNQIDRCCKDHDDCYGHIGVTWQMNTYKRTTSEQRQCIQDCDEALCWCLSRFTLAPMTDQERRARTAILFYFCARPSAASR